MARLNVVVERSPNNGVEAGVYSREGVTDHDDLQDPSEDEKAAGMLNSARKAKAVNRTQSPGGLLSNIRKLWPARKPLTSEEIQHPNTVEGEDLPRIGDIALEAAEEESEPLNSRDSPVPAHSTSTAGQHSSSTKLPRVKRGSVNLVNQKRPAEQRDIYEVPDQEEVEQGKLEASVKRPRRTLVKAEEPHVRPKKSNGQHLPTVNRQTESYHTLESLESKKVQFPVGTKSGRSEAYSGPVTSRVSSKRQRGRPRKVPTSVLVINGENTGPSSSVTSTIAPANHTTGDTEGVSGLLDPSPIKVDGSPRTAVQRHQEEPRIDLEPANSSQTGQQQAVSSLESKRSFEDTTQAVSQHKNKLLDLEILNSMLQDAEHVGYTQKRVSKEWQFVKRPAKSFTRPGKRLARRLEVLQSLYNQAADVRDSGDFDTSSELYVAITSTVHLIKEETDQILTNRLGNPSLGIEYFAETPTRSILVDLYFSVFPKLIKAMTLAAKTYNEDETSSLREFGDLVDVYHRLAETAVDQPKDFQPDETTVPPKVTGRTIGFRVIQPTRQILPRIRNLQNNIKVELARRLKAERAVERRSIVLEREKSRQEQEQIEEWEHRRQIKWIHKRQREDIERQLADPVWGEMLREQIARAESAAEARQAEKEFEQLRKPRVRITCENEHQEANNVDVEAGSFEDDPFEPRLKMFGQNSHQKRSQPWSDKRKAAFIDFLRAYDGNDRFARLAERFQCSMDEIFEYAKELQEAMDDAHANGHFVDKEDDWTYKIWVKNI